MSSRVARSRKRLTASCGPRTWTGSGCDGSTSLIRRTQAGRRASERLRCGRYMACLPPIPCEWRRAYLANNISLAICLCQGLAIYGRTDIFTSTHVRAGYGHSGAATGATGEARDGADRAPSAERARLLDHQRAVPREDRAGRVCDARGAVRGSGLWGGGDPRARSGKEADAFLTSSDAP